MSTIIGEVTELSRCRLTVRSVSILHNAVSRLVVVCEAMVACGSDIDATNVVGDTPLMWAVLQEKINVVSLFLALKADTTTTGSRGWNVSRTRNAEILQLLVEHSKKTVSFIALPHADVTFRTSRLCNANKHDPKH